MALPSITGTSGPSISIKALSIREPGERREEVLHGRDGGALRIAEHRAKLGRADGVGTRGNFDVGGVRKVGAEEAYAAVHVGGAEGDRDGRAAVNANSAESLRDA